MIERLRLTAAMIPNEWMVTISVFALQLAGLFGSVDLPFQNVGLVISIASFILFLVVNLLTRNPSLTGAIAAFLVSSAALAAELVPTESFMLYKLAGACGGAIAVPVFLKEQRPARWALLFIVGMFIGVASCRFVLEFFEWREVGEYWMLSALIGAVGGWVGMNALFAKDTLKTVGEAVRNFLRGLAK